MVERLYTLGEAGRILGVCTKTLQRWDRRGVIRVVRTPGNRRRVPESEVVRKSRANGASRVIGYIRVPNGAPRGELRRQAEQVRQYAEQQGLGDVEIISDVGGGLSARRRGLGRLLDLVEARQVRAVVVSAPHALAPFGQDALERYFGSYGARIDAVNVYDDVAREELARYLVETVAFFSRKIYGPHTRESLELVRAVRGALGGLGGAPAGGK